MNQEYKALLYRILNLTPHVFEKGEAPEFYCALLREIQRIEKAKADEPVRP